MKIAYILEGEEEIRWPPYNGPANHVRQIIKGLIQRGHSVRVLARLDGQIWRSDDLETFIPVRAVPLDRGWLHFIERLIRKVQTVLRLPYFGYFESLRFAQACRRELAGFDIFLERFNWMMYGGLIAARKMNLPWVAEYNGNPLDDLAAKHADPQGLQRLLSNKLTRWTLNSADHIVASGDGWRRSCEADWGVKPEKLSVIENGTELLQLLERSALNAFNPIDTTRPVQIIYLGGFYPWHGIDVLLRALDQARSSHSDLRLTLIGAGSGMEHAQQLTDTLKLTPYVQFTGHLRASEYAPYLAQADIGVSPYCGWQEYSGLKLFDYKAAGLACIASGENGQPATLEHGVTGWIVPPCDELALAQALLHLATQSDMRRKIGQSARQDAEDLHSWDNSARKIEQVLIDLVEARGRK